MATKKNVMLLFVENTSVKDCFSELRLFCRTITGEMCEIQVRDFLNYMWVCTPSEQCYTADRLVSQHPYAFRNAKVTRVDNGVQSVFRNFGSTDVAFRVEYLNRWDASNIAKCFPEEWVFEHTNVSLEQRFLIDRKCVPGGWIEVLDTTAPQLATDIIGLSGDTGAPEPLNAELANMVAPLYFLWFDIECVDRRGCFPDEYYGEVVCIACILTCRGEVVKKSLLATRPAEPLDDGCVLVVAGSERSLFEMFGQLVRAWNPDFIGGYNSNGFDWPHLIKRAEIIGARQMLFDISRTGKPASVRENNPGQKGRYKDKYVVTLPGRQSYDLMGEMIRNLKLSSYSLNSVSKEVLNDTKSDVHHSLIVKLWDRSDADRKRLFDYCIKDAVLPFRIAQKMQLELRMVEMARVTGVGFRQLLESGQQLRAISQLLRTCRERNMIVPMERLVTGYAPSGQFDGAIVLEPEVGYYPPETPVMTLDFQSLYPSLMICHNYSFDTLLPAPTPTSFTSPCGYHFEQSYRGILPDIVSMLLLQRAKAKKDLKKAKSDGNEEMVQIQDARQLALKLSANSIYGFTGVSIESGGAVPCFEVSESVTASGREAIEATQKYVRGLEGTKVIYGDTDSVFVVMGKQTKAEAFATMRTLAADITRELFKPPMLLTPEKIIVGMVLMARKRYIGLVFDDPDKEQGKMFFRGTESVRRDNCPLVPETINACCDYIFVRHDIAGAMNVAREQIRRLYERRVELHELLITKSLSRETDEYANLQSHAVLVEKMRQRDKSLVVHVGDRIPFIMVSQGQKITDQAEDPLYVLDHNVPYDVSYYMEHQLRNPLERLFTPIVGPEAVHELFHGAHTRHIVQTSVGGASHGIAKFFTRKYRCLVCKRAETPTRICLACKQEPLRLDAAREEVSDQLGAAKRKFSEIYASCQRCQGNSDEVTCMQRDCSQLYVRKGAQKKMMDMEDMFKAF